MGARWGSGPGRHTGLPQQQAPVRGLPHCLLRLRSRVDIASGWHGAGRAGLTISMFSWVTDLSLLSILRNV